MPSSLLERVRKYGSNPNPGSGGLSKAEVEAITAEKISALSSVHMVAASGAAQTIAFAEGAIWDITLTANCTLTFPTPEAGKSFTLELEQDATGSRTVTWPANARWSNGVYPTLSTAAEAVDIIYFQCFDGAHWAGFPGGYSMAVGGSSPTVPAVVQTALNLKLNTSEAPRAILQEGSCIIPSAQGQSIFMIAPGLLTAGLGVTGSGNLSGNFWFDPADYEIEGRTPKLRVTAVCMTPETASTITHVVSLYPVASVGGATTTLKNTLGSQIAASKLEFVNQPKETIGHQKTSDFAVPTAGMYVLVDTTSATNTTNCETAIWASLSLHWV